jgi:hypothetical protein
VPQHRLGGEGTVEDFPQEVTSASLNRKQLANWGSLPHVY